MEPGINRIQSRLFGQGANRDSASGKVLQTPKKEQVVLQVNSSRCCSGGHFCKGIGSLMSVSVNGTVFPFDIKSVRMPQTPIHHLLGKTQPLQMTMPQERLQRRCLNLKNLKTLQRNRLSEHFSTFLDLPRK
jgi:hypothetical protein